MALPKFVFSFLGCLSLFTLSYAQLVNINGRVFDEDLIPLHGVKIALLSNPALQVTTDSDGYFSMISNTVPSSSIAPSGILVEGSGYVNTRVYLGTLSSGSIGDMVLAKSAAVPSVRQLLVPQNCYVLNHGGEILNIYKNNLVYTSLSGYNLTITSPFGTVKTDSWEFSPYSILLANRSITLFPVRFELKNSSGTMVETAVTYITLINQTASVSVGVLCIGDSFTRNGGWVKRIGNVLSGVKLEGIRHYDSKDPEYLNREGRGGWRINYYLQFGTGSRYSPFMFPVGIDGAKYWGDADFWKSVITDESGYDYAGFQKIARGWKETGSPYHFDSNGYPKNPVIGDVIRAEGVIKEYKGSAWETRPQQPSGQIDIKKYIDRYKAAFTIDGVFEPPRIVNILTGINEFRSSGSTESSRNSWGDIMDSLINALQNYDSTITVIVGITTQTKNEINTFKEIDRFILDRWDNEASRSRRIFLAPVHAVMDPVNGLSSDGIHPGSSGYDQLGESFAGVVQMARNLFYDTLTTTYPPVDCNGILAGSAYYDSCGICAGGNTGLTPNDNCNTDCGNPVQVHDSDNDGNVPQNTLDGNPGTRWSSNADTALIVYSFPCPRKLSLIGISFYRGNERSTIFDLAISKDSSDWVEIFNGQSSGSALEMEGFEVSPQRVANYIRIRGYGNTYSEWTSITDVQFDFALEEDCKGIKGGTASSDNCQVRASGNTGSTNDMLLNFSTGDNSIFFNLVKSGSVTLTIFSLTGKKIQLLQNKGLSAGMHKISLKNSDFASGVYMCKIQLSRNHGEWRRIFVK